MPFAAITTPIDHCTQTADTEKVVSAVQDAALGMRVELIVIDTLSRVMAGGNENQPDAMGAFVRNIDRLRAATGAAVLIVHHSRKDASRGARRHILIHTPKGAVQAYPCDAPSGRIYWRLGRFCLAVTCRHRGVTVTASDASRHVTPPYKGCDGVTVTPERRLDYSFGCARAVVSDDGETIW